jgi:ATP-dependent Clp protease adaptor protein ClpS
MSMRRDRTVREATEPGPAGGIETFAARAMSEGTGPPRDPERDEEREGGLATRTRKRVARPPRYKVLLYNDDYTPMEFVVSLLEQVFDKGPSEANAIMLAIHRGGMGVAGVYVLEVAETKVAMVHSAAEDRGYPLRAGVEKE